MSAAALLICLWINEGPLWRLLLTKMVPLSEIGQGLKQIQYGHETRGWVRVKRTPTVVKQRSYLVPHGEFVSYYVENGYKASEGKLFGWDLETTQWAFDGTVKYQVRARGDNPQITKHSPPWLWGVTDQTEPTAPWWNEKDK